MGSDSELPATGHDGEKSVEMIKFQLTELTRIVKDVSKKMDTMQEQNADNRVWKERIENRLTEGNKTMNGIEKQIELNERKSEHQFQHCQDMARAAERLAEAKAKEIDMVMSKRFEEAAAAAKESNAGFVRKEQVKWILIGITIAGGTSGAIVHHLMNMALSGK